MAKEFLNFAEIKANADLTELIDRLGLFGRLSCKGSGEYVSHCPLGKTHGKNDSFSINTMPGEGGEWQCSACNKKGSILDLAAYLLDTDLRDAAKYVRDVSTGDDDEKAMEAASQEKGTLDELIEQATRGEDCTLLVAVMSLGEALQRIKRGELERADVRVVDMSTLRFLDTVAENQHRRQEGKNGRVAV